MTHWGLRPVTCQGPQFPSQSLTTGTRMRSPLPADSERNDKCTHLLPRQLTHAHTHFSLLFRPPVDSRCPLDIFSCQYQLFLRGGRASDSVVGGQGKRWVEKDGCCCWRQWKRGGGWRTGQQRHYPPPDLHRPIIARWASS